MIIVTKEMKNNIENIGQVKIIFFINIPYFSQWYINSIGKLKLV